MSKEDDKIKTAKLIITNDIVTIEPIPEKTKWKSNEEWFDEQLSKAYGMPPHSTTGIDYGSIEEARKRQDAFYRNNIFSFVKALRTVPHIYDDLVWQSYLLGIVRPLPRHLRPRLVAYRYRKYQEKRNQPTTSEE